jgi:hypothetical protein
MKSLFNTFDYKEIIDRINKLAPDSKPTWGKMTVNEMICHITDPLRDLIKIRITKPVIPFFLRPLMQKILITEKPWGKNSPTVKPYLQAPKGGGTKPRGFQTDQSLLISILDQFHSIKDDFVLGEHGALGKLSKDKAGKFMWKHLDHHLRQFGV